MPELAEVEYFRRQWDAANGLKVVGVHLNAGRRPFRGCDTKVLKRELAGCRLAESLSHGK